MAKAPPFIIKVETAYMEVPYCRTCRFWHESYMSEGSKYRMCTASMEQGSKQLPGFGGLHTMGDFGCVEHKSREEGT